MPTPPAFEIRCNPKLIQEFRHAAKKAFPKEIYGVFLGVFDEPDVVEVVEMLLCPKEETVRSTQWVVMPSEAWLAEVEKSGKEDDLVVVGDIHSHCSTKENGFYCETAPSEGDWASVPHYQGLFKGNYTFMAIMALNKGETKIRTKVNFWPLLPPVKVTWSENE